MGRCRRVNEQLVNHEKHLARVAPMRQIQPKTANFFVDSAESEAGLVSLVDPKSPTGTTTLPFLYGNYSV